MGGMGATSTDSPPREKIDVPIEFDGKLPRTAIVFLEREKDPIVLFPVSASAQDLRTLDVGKEIMRELAESSPRGVLEDGLRFSDTETSTSKASPSNSETQPIPNNYSLWRGLFRMWRPKLMHRLSSFPPTKIPKPSRTRSSREGRIPRSNCITNDEFCFVKPSWKHFTQSELLCVTNNFSPENLIGKGGYAEVYKGCLEDGQLVAIKRLTRGTSDERTSTFLSELGILVHINHPNAANLIGVGAEGGMHLVFQLSPHGSLANVLHGLRGKLDWGIRYKVALGTAEGLVYLHEKCQRRIIHRDIKAANILLTEDFEPQISDFGLAKWLPDKLTHHTVSSFEGTFGYLAPEYFMHGIVDEKIDVFAFGVLLLELITGRKALDSSQQSLVMWARPLLETNELKELVDPSLSDIYDYDQLNRTAMTASLCIQNSSILRPNMSQVLMLLKGQEGRSGIIKAHRKSHLRRTYSEELVDAEEYNATRYLNDLRRHRQLALDC